MKISVALIQDRLWACHLGPEWVFILLDSSAAPGSLIVEPNFSLDVSNTLRYYLLTQGEVTMTLDDLTLNLEQHINVKASPEKAFAAVLHRLGKGNTRPDGQSLDMQIEPRAGGRWYRDRGNGIGHLWGFVQVIKAPNLLELSGPMFMSYPAINHVEFKIEPAAEGCKVTLRHRAIGMIDPEHRKGIGEGWKHMLQSAKKDSEAA